MKYKLIRDKRIFSLDESEIEICDTKEEICDYSIKELLNLISELKETNFEDIETYTDIMSILDNIIRVNNIDEDEILLEMHRKIKKYGNFSKYLLKIH